MLGSRHALKANTSMKNVHFVLFSLWWDSWRLLWFYLVPRRLLLPNFICAEFKKKKKGGNKTNW